MIEIALTTLLVVAVIGIFIPKRHVPGEKRKVRHSKHGGAELTGLPWMGGKVKKKKDFWYD